MAIGADTLEKVAATGYGPLSLRREGSGYLATLDGRQALVTLDRDAVAIQAGSDVPWPREQARQQEIDARVQAALLRIALGRPELLTAAGDPASASIAVSTWIPSTGDVADLAAAVRITVLAAEAARLAVEQVAAAVAAEQQMLAAAEKSAASLEEAERLLREAEAVPTQPVPATATAPAQQAPAPPAPTPATRYCPSCGAANPSQNRFCVSCGTGLA